MINNPKPVIKAEQLSTERTRVPGPEYDAIGVEQQEVSETTSNASGLEKQEAVVPVSSTVSRQQAQQVIAQADEELKLIEGILSDGMEDIYKELAPQKQQEFKTKGEEVARKIREMIDSAKIQSKKIVHWIMEWLRIIPHVNKFFLKQEAKLKTDRIMKLVENRKKE